MKVIGKTKFISLFLLFSLLFALAFSPYHALMRHDLRADDASYLSHGFTLGLDHNLQYENRVADWETQNGRAAAHPIGPGLLASPFIALFSLVDRIMNDPVIADHRQYQYSWSYFGFVFSTIFYFIAALFLYARGLEKLSMPLPRIQFWLLSVSFGILYYVLFRPLLGHAFQFFTLGLCFYYSAAWTGGLKDQPKIQYKNLLGIAIGCVLTLSIRPSDLNVILLPFIILTAYYGIKDIKIESALLKRSILVLGAFLTLALIPYMLINQCMYGMIYPSPEAMYGDHFTQLPPLVTLSDYLDAILTLLMRIPQILIICFSSEFGLAFTSATLFYGSLFLLFYLGVGVKDRHSWTITSLLLSLIYIGTPVAIILFWQSVGDAYGYRFLYCVFPLAILGYAVWYHRANNAKTAQWVILTFCVFGVFSSSLFGLNEDLLIKPNQPNAFGQGHDSAVGYSFSVLRAIPDKNIWINCAATRTPGFYALGLLDYMEVEIDTLPLPKVVSIKLDKFKQVYHYPPLQVYVQVLLLGLMFIGGSVLFCRLYFIIQ